jgi:hypothetical protein
MVKSGYLLVIMSFFGSHLSAATPLNCERLKRAEAGPVVCQMNTLRMAADSNHGVATPGQLQELADCESAARKQLLTERDAFFAEHKRQIKRLRPKFVMQKASDEDWADLMYAEPTMCELKASGPNPDKNSN